jgi:WXG100 family type VII secretion target
VLSVKGDLMAATTVRSNYDELKSIQNTFNQNAGAIASMNQNVKSRVETLQGGDWIGQAATKFYQEMDSSVMPSLNRLQKALTEAARITQQIANTMKQAEDEASSIFKL